MRRAGQAVVAAIVLAAAAWAQSAKAEPPLLPSEQVVNAYMQRMFGYDPQVKWSIVAIEPAEVPGMAKVMLRLGEGEGRLTQLFVSGDGKHAVVGEYLPFGADPFADVRRTLERRADGPSRGPKTAPVTLVEFADLQCPACRSAQPTVERLLTESPNARFIFQHFPLEAIHKWAFRAATYSQCVWELKPEAVWDFNSKVYARQNEITEQTVDEQLKALVGQVGLSPDGVRNCANGLATIDKVRASFELGRELGVTSTPTLFVNGRKIPLGGVPYERVKAIVDFEARTRK